MKYSGVKGSLRGPRIVGRLGTMRSQFRRAIVPGEDFDNGKAQAAIAELEQSDLTDLRCVYCHAKAMDWDHVHPVGGSKDSEGAKRGHRLRNLVPACRVCNGAKGGSEITVFFDSNHMRQAVPDGEERQRRLAVVLRYAESCERTDPMEETEASAELWRVFEEIHQLMRQADVIAGRISKGS